MAEITGTNKVDTFLVVLTTTELLLLAELVKKTRTNYTHELDHCLYAGLIYLTTTIYEVAKSRIGQKG